MKIHYDATANQTMIIAEEKGGEKEIMRLNGDVVSLGQKLGDGFFITRTPRTGLGMRMTDDNLLMRDDAGKYIICDELSSVPGEIMVEANADEKLVARRVKNEAVNDDKEISEKADKYRFVKFLYEGKGYAGAYKLIGSREENGFSFDIMQETTHLKVSANQKGTVQAGEMILSSGRKMPYTPEQADLIYAQFCNRAGAEKGKSLFEEVQAQVKRRGMPSGQRAEQVISDFGKNETLTVCDAESNESGINLLPQENHLLQFTYEMHGQQGDFKTIGRSRQHGCDYAVYPDNARVHLSFDEKGIFRQGMQVLPNGIALPLTAKQATLIYSELCCGELLKKNNVRFSPLIGFAKETPKSTTNGAKRVVQKTNRQLPIATKMREGKGLD